jgi:hypothetical protein
MEIIVKDLRSLPVAVSSSLKKMRQMDINCRDKLNKLKEQEDKLIEELMKAEKDHKENSTPIDEEYFINQYNQIMESKQAILNQIDEKISFGKTVYDFVDRKIQYLDYHTHSVKHLLIEGQDESLDASMKKKKKRKQREEEVIQINDKLYVSDANEPLYCTCRRVSFGNMIGCDNAECPTEWFHFECVNLTVAPSVWYCPTCRPSFPDFKG